MSDTTTTDTKPDIVKFTFRGQVYTRVDIKPQRRADGSETRLAIWESRCPTCGDTFTFTSSRLRSPRWPRRRCPRHRAPGRRVVFEGAPR